MIVDLGVRYVRHCQQNRKGHSLNFHYTHVEEFEVYRDDETVELRFDSERMLVRRAFVLDEAGRVVCSVKTHGSKFHFPEWAGKANEDAWAQKDEWHNNKGESTLWYESLSPRKGRRYDADDKVTCLIFRPNKRGRFQVKYFFKDIDYFSGPARPLLGP